jgi:hypothetical protein
VPTTMGPAPQLCQIWLRSAICAPRLATRGTTLFG